MRIGSKIFVVGGIPIVIAAGIALAAIILSHEADRARSGAVLAGTAYRNLLAAVTDRNDYIAAAVPDRDRFRNAFAADTAHARADLASLQDLSRAAERPAIEEARITLARYVDSMDKLAAVTGRNDGLVAAMASRANLLISLADQARERQHASNADIVTSLADGDRRLRAARDIVDAAYGLRLGVAAIQAGQLDLRTSCRSSSSGADASRKLGFDLGKLRHVTADIVGLLEKRDSQSGDPGHDRPGRGPAEAPRRLEGGPRPRPGRSRVGRRHPGP